jgi:hypothetical protein
MDIFVVVDTFFVKGKSSLKFQSGNYKTSEAFSNLKYTIHFKCPVCPVLLECSPAIG